MDLSVDAAILRTVALEELPSELESLRLRTSDESITKQLLNAVGRGSISTPVFGIWIGVCKSPYVIQQALIQKLSVRIRHLGIKQLRRSLESPQWEQVWQGIGGTAGLLEIFSDLSVEEIKAVCKAISRCTSDGDLTRKDEHLTEKRERVTELFKSLHPAQFPEVGIKSRDLRPLTKYYQLLVPSCTAELVEWISSAAQDGSWQFVKERELLKHHSEAIGKSALHVVFGSQSPDIKSKDRLRKLSTQFPPISGSRHGFSASMSFALSLLRRIVETDAKEIEDYWVVEHLIRPLLNRAIRKRIPWPQTQQVADLAMQYFEHHPKARENLANTKGHIVHMMAGCWSRRSNLFEAQVKRLLSFGFGRKTSLEDLTILSAGVPRSRKYALLHMCCQEVMGLDLDSESDLSKLNGTLSCDILNGLEASQALGLFKRLRQARGDANLVSPGPFSSVLSARRTSTSVDGDPDINYLVLLNRNGLQEEAESYAANMLILRKKVTDTSANREARAENAISVWACANASGSIKLLNETLQWAKRFIGDQLTASKLYSTYYDETYRLLSGFLAHGNASLNTQGLRLRVTAANAFMADMLELACLGLREPSFQIRDWRNAIDLFTCVVKQRIELSAEMKKEMKASDEDLYCSLWQDTISVLLRVEKMLNLEDNKKLGAGTISGVVVWTTVFYETKRTKLRPIERSTWEFIDALSKARNRLWAELRSARYPDVLTLPSSFPRGLPVQVLVAGWTPNVLDLDRIAPYISLRVHETLFANPEAALEPIKAPRSLMPAIGCFVDSYPYALQLYIPQHCERHEKKERLLKVWNHATGALSAQRMDHQEAIRFWKKIVPWYLQNTLSEILPTEESVSWRPLIPTFEDPSQILEWNPLQGRPTDVTIEQRKLLQLTYIDFSTSGRQAQGTNPILGSLFELPEPSIPAEYRSAPGIWSSCEAFTLAALLLLDAKYCTTNTLLSGPYPSSSDIRFPCVFLDEGFLSLEEVKSSDAVSYITRNLVDVPLTLVHKIATNMVGKMDTKVIGTSSTLEGAAFSILRALANGDRPGLAFDLAIKVIMEQPDTSSWHRILFNQGFLQRLPASDAKACFSTYAEAIAEKLDTLKSIKESRPVVGQGGTEAAGVDGVPLAREHGAPGLNKPVIKITTLKSLAQLLNRSSYIADDDALGILLTLAEKVKHIDVRVSILRTLLSKLEINRPELWNTVLSALESFVPLAGSINEREPGIRISLEHKGIGGVRKSVAPNVARPELSSSSASDNSTTSDSTTSDDSTPEPSQSANRRGSRGSAFEARRRLCAREIRKRQEKIRASLSRDSITMPVMQVTTAYTWQDESPMLGALMNHLVKLNGSNNIWQMYMDNIVLPLLDTLMAQTAEWTMLFLHKYAPEDFDILEAKLPSVPKGVQIFDEILSRSASKLNRIPRRILDQLVDYLTFILNPPAWLLLLNQRLEHDPALKTLPEVEIWFKLYGTDRNDSWSRPWGVLPFHRIVNFNTDNTEGDDLNITSSLYKEAFIKVFKELLWNDSPGYARLSALVSTIVTDESEDNGGRTILESMIAHVNSLHTRDWERNPDRTPAVLPDPFVWRLKLLSHPGPCASDSDEAREGSCRRLSQELAAILDEISSSVYHTKLQLIKEQIRRSQHAVQTALYLGDISKTRLSWLTTPELLRVDLAAEMMMQSRDHDIEPLEGRVKELLGTWIASENEEVRRTGYRLCGELFDTDGGWRKSASRW